MYSECEKRRKIRKFIVGEKEENCKFSVGEKEENCKFIVGEREEICSEKISNCGLKKKV